jgi:hypothetical protein
MRYILALALLAAAIRGAHKYPPAQITLSDQPVEFHPNDVVLKS